MSCSYTSAGEEIDFESRWVEPLLGPPQPGILTIELRATLPPTGGPGRRVCVYDTNRLDSLSRTELGVEAPPGVVLRQAGTTDPPPALSPYESVAEAPGVSVPRALCAVFDAPPVRPRLARAKWLRSKPLRIGAGVAGALALLVAVAATVARRKHHRARPPA